MKILCYLRQNALIKPKTIGYRNKDKHWVNPRKLTVNIWKRQEIFHCDQSVTQVWPHSLLFHNGRTPSSTDCTAALSIRYTATEQVVNKCRLQLQLCLPNCKIWVEIKVFRSKWCISSAFCCTLICTTYQL